MPQILQNFSARSTGQLSLITYALNTAGAAARIFTSIQEKAGAAMLRGAIISELAVSGVAVLWRLPPEQAFDLVDAGALLNAVLALQIVVYGNKPAARGKKKTV